MTLRKIYGVDDIKEEIWSKCYKGGDMELMTQRWNEGVDDIKEEILRR